MVLPLSIDILLFFVIPYLLYHHYYPHIILGLCSYSSIPIIQPTFVLAFLPFPCWWISKTWYLFSQKIQKYFFLKNITYLFYVYECSVYVSTSTCQKRTSDLMTDVCEPPCGGWELNSEPLEKQPMLLTTEPSLQSQAQLSCAGIKRIEG